jgi:hypothetical protein
MTNIAQQIDLLIETQAEYVAKFESSKTNLTNTLAAMFKANGHDGVEVAILSHDLVNIFADRIKNQPVEQFNIKSDYGTEANPAITASYEVANQLFEMHKDAFLVECQVKFMNRQAVARFHNDDVGAIPGN